MQPTIVQLIRMDDGRWSWSVDFEDRGLCQDGYVATFDQAQACIRSAMDNANADSASRVTVSFLSSEGD